jgi:hypothetical protein
MSRRSGGSRRHRRGAEEPADLAVEQDIADGLAREGDEQHEQHPRQGAERRREVEIDADGEHDDSGPARPGAEPGGLVVDEVGRRRPDQGPEGRLPVVDGVEPQPCLARRQLGPLELLDQPVEPVDLIETQRRYHLRAELDVGAVAGAGLHEQRGGQERNLQPGHTAGGHAAASCCR